VRFSILHVSDLHRDLSDEISNPWLLESLRKDVAQFERETPKIGHPSIAIVTGDLVYGASPDAADVAKELERQYAQAEEFLIGIADQFFNGQRERVVILPGNHDVSYHDVMKSVCRVDIPSEPGKRAVLVAELFMPRSRLRWSWRDLCFYRIIDEERYLDRLSYFAATYERFYERRRTFPRDPARQFDVFDFHDLAFSVITLNSCFDNDPLRRAGGMHPDALAAGYRALREPRRAGWLTAAAWHHNFVGGPTRDDYLDAEFLQLFIDAGVSLGFHGHQHSPDCFDERCRIGPDTRKITIVSASTLCAEPRNLTPGVPRSYNIVEVDNSDWIGRVHQRQMVNKLFNLPVWGPGRFISTNSSFCDFSLCKPLVRRPDKLDTQLNLERADLALGSGKWLEALDILGTVRAEPLARPLLLRAAVEFGDPHRIIAGLWPPLTIAEAVTVGGAILTSGTRDEAEAFVRLALVAESADASVRDISRRITQRRLI
jgi:DNA repair exonuclease SbcCD nuclease subunit